MGRVRRVGRATGGHAERRSDLVGGGGLGRSGHLLLQRIEDIGEEFVRVLLAAAGELRRLA